VTARRFVVQEHTVAPGDVHYDLMIEAGDALVTFQLDAAPEGPGARGRRSFDHRRRYLDYEGEVSGGRGRVAIWDRGTVTDEAGTPRAARYRGAFRGARLQGRIEIEAGGAEGEPARLRRLESTP